MTQIFYILFGWFLGLLGPTIVDYFRSVARTREICSGLRVELEDLQFRFAMSSFLLLQRRGELTTKFVAWFKSMLDKYSGNEPIEVSRKAISQLAAADEKTLEAIASQLRSKEGTGLGLKTFQAGFLESHLQDISKLKTATQRKLHEFRNHLAILNQDISKANQYALHDF
jgi:hypothetical protein